MARWTSLVTRSYSAWNMSHRTAVSNVSATTPVEHNEEHVNHSTRVWSSPMHGNLAPLGASASRRYGADMKLLFHRSERELSRAVSEDEAWTRVSHAPSCHTPPCFSHKRWHARIWGDRSATAMLSKASSSTAPLPSPSPIAKHSMGDTSLTHTRGPVRGFHSPLGGGASVRMQPKSHKSRDNEKPPHVRGWV